MTSSIRSGALARIALALGVAATPALAHQGHDHAPRRSEMGAFARDLPQGAAHPASAATPALIPGLGPLTWPGASRDRVARAYFEQGLNLAWGFNHAEAVRAFRAAQSYDPGCALCLWGEAWALGPNINMPMDADANAQAMSAIERARSLALRQGALVQGLVEALALRHSAELGAERAALDRAYAEAMRRLHERHFQEIEVKVLLADALMNLTPWNYWEEEGRKPKGATEEILVLLEQVLGIRPMPTDYEGTPMRPPASSPDHIGAIHLYIHMVEASDRPERAAPFAARLAELAPANGHLVHMPAHVWYRMGEWRRSLEANRAAVAADRAMIARGGASRLYAEGYYPHNLHFVLASALMGGDGPAAVQAAEEMARLVSDRTAAEVAWTQPIQAAPYVAHARFSEPRAVLALPAPEGGFVRAHWHYARGVAFAQLGQAAEATQEAAAARELALAPDVSALEDQGVPGATVVGIAARLVEARLATAAGRHAQAAEAFREAAEQAEALPYMEPPWWFDPIRPAQGAALLQAGRAADAAQVFRAALARQPNDGWSAAGLLAAAQRLQDRGAEEQARGTLSRNWFGTALPRPERM